jgi:hypothetical protein
MTCSIFGLWKIYVKSTLINQDVKLIESRSQMVFLIDNSFTPIEIKKIESAFNYWEEITDFYVNFIILPIDTSQDMNHWAEDKVATIYNSQSLFHWSWHTGQLLNNNATDTIGLTNIITCDIFIFDNDNELFEQVITHEIGHVLGLEHVNDRKNLMYPYILSSAKQINQKQIDSIKTFIALLPFVGEL